jgi:hypothetical protein
MSKEILAPGTIEPYNKKNIELETGENWPLKILVCSPGTQGSSWNTIKAKEVVQVQSFIEHLLVYKRENYKICEKNKVHLASTSALSNFFCVYVCKQEIALKTSRKKEF